MKELSDIAWQVDEPTYRAAPELSYSTLSTYESVGFNGLDHLFDKKESPSLTFGSAVDAILTGGQSEFEKLFFVADFPSIGDKELQIAKYLFDAYPSYESLDTMPSTYILDASNTFQFQKNWRDETRVKVITERCNSYYQIRKSSEGKSILNTDTYNNVCNCVEALRNSPATSGCFADNDPLSNLKRYYQLKFKFYHNNVGYRSMMDLIIVDYDRRIIYPYDLKTSLSCSEWDFQDNFKKWHY